MVHTKKRLIVSAGIIAVMLLAAIPSVYFYRQYKEAQSRLAHTTQNSQEDTKLLIEKVGSLLELPTEEEPTLATVSDVEKLRDQPFFAKAQNGDRVLIYTSTKKAILYRPSTNKIIDIAPVNIGSPSATPAVTGIRFILLNGTTKTGLTKTYETELKEKVQHAVVVDRDNAKKQDYEKSILVDVTGAKSTQAAELARTLGLDLSALPEGETKPANTDFLVILGIDIQ